MKTTIAIRDTAIGNIRRINGGCLAPPIHAENAGLNLRKHFNALYLPITRLHDAPLDNPGLSLVDVPMIFPLFHADENDPRNYNFKTTDDYIANIAAAGTQIFYRLGVSIDHSYNKYVIDPPADTDKWIRIVEHIIDHYNNGWANGFHYGIQYWEIWNEAEGINSGDEPHLHTMWNAPVETYYAFYAKVAKALKTKYPELKIGGPSNVQWAMRDNRYYALEFLNAVKDADAPLDFYSFHAYMCHLVDISSQIVEIRDKLDSLGFTQTEIHLAEWSFSPPGMFVRLRSNGGRDALEVLKETANATAGAFVAATMIRFQDLPVDMTYYYTVTCGTFGLFDRISHLPKKSYFTLKAFGELALNYPTRIDAAIRDFEGEKLPIGTCDLPVGHCETLAGRDENGNIAIMAANYHYGPCHIHFDFSTLGNFSKAELTCIDDQDNAEPLTSMTPAPNGMDVTSSSESAVFVLKLWR